MKKQTRNKGLEVEIGVTKLKADHKGGKLKFIYPIKGPNTYFNIRERILESNSRTPTLSENASLVYSAWQNPKEKYSKEIRDILRNNWLWCFNGILYEPKEGAYIQDNPEIKDNQVIINKSDLVKKLESNDSSVRFVPFGYKTGEQTSEQLANNKLVQALATPEGAEKLAEVSSKYKNNPHVWGFDKVDQKLVRVASLSSGRDLGGRLYVDSYSDVVGGCGCALGVSEAS